MSALQDKQLFGPATPEDPVLLDLGNGDAVLSRVACWYEDGDYVIRSLEYDVIAGADDVVVAVQRFVRNSAEYARLLIESNDRTEADVELAAIIVERLTDFLDTLPNGEDQKPRRPGLLERIRGRRGQPADHGWRLRHAAQT